MAHEENDDPVTQLRQHNDRLQAMLTEEGRAELDRLLILETLLLARLYSGIKQLKAQGLDDLAKQSAMTDSEIQNTLTDEARTELAIAANDDDDQGFFGKAWDKCKSVANDKAKGFTKSWMGDGSDDDG